MPWYYLDLQENRICDVVYCKIARPSSVPTVKPRSKHSVTVSGSTPSKNLALSDWSYDLRST